MLRSPKRRCLHRAKASRMTEVEIPHAIADHALAQVRDMIRVDVEIGYVKDGDVVSQQICIKKLIVTTSCLLDHWLYGKVGLDPNDMKGYEKYRSDVYKAVVDAIGRSNLPFKIAVMETTEDKMMDLMRKQAEGTLKTAPKSEGPPAVFMLSVSRFRKKRGGQTP